MTGQGVGRAEIGEGRGVVVVEVRAVNHRYLDVRQRVSSELAEHAAALEARVRKSLVRGRVEVSARCEGSLAGTPALDKDAARAAFAQLCELRDELRPDEPVPLSLLGAVPDLWRAASAADPEALADAVARATDAACAAVWEMRRVEGQALADDLGRHVDALEEAAGRVGGRTGEVVDAYRARLRARIDALLEGSGVNLDPGRLEQEVALLADRADVSEELSRLASHVEQVRTLLAEPEARGKRLDFLLQEMSREANTVGSKSSDARFAHAVVDMKAAISRMREQAQNVL